MLRVFAGLSLMSSAVAVAQTAPSTPPVAPVAAPVAVPAPVVVEAEAPVVEEPKMKKVCHAEDVVGSAFPRMVCKMKPIKPKSAM